MVAEMIREKLLRTLDKEVPHGIAVDLERYLDDKQEPMSAKGMGYLYNRLIELDAKLQKCDDIFCVCE